MKSNTRKAIGGTRLGRWRTVADRTGLSRSAIYRAQQTDPSFPKAVRLLDGGRSVAWPLDEIDAWVEMRIERGRIDSRADNSTRAQARRARAAARKPRQRVPA